MAKGGKRPGAGRKKGSANKASAAREARIAESGETPLDYMIRVMRDPKAKAARRDRMAELAAPYVHPRLTATQHSGPKGGPIELDLTRFTNEQLAALEPVLALLATLTGGAGGAAGPGEGGAPSKGG